MTSAVIVERRGATALLRLNSPANMNAISLELRSELAQALPGLLQDRAVRCVIVTGSGDAFSAGGDLKQMADRRSTAVRERLQWAHRWCRLLLESEEHTSELQSRENLVCRLLLEKKKKKIRKN